MKTRIVTLTTLFLLTINMASAESFRTLKLYDNLGHCMNILVKEEIIQENFDFNTLEVFNEMKGVNNSKPLDITPFIKPEMEVEENLPVYVE